MRLEILSFVFAVHSSIYMIDFIRQKWISILWKKRFCWNI